MCVSYVGRYIYIYPLVYILLYIYLYIYIYIYNYLRRYIYITLVCGYRRSADIYIYLGAGSDVEGRTPTFWYRAGSLQITCIRVTVPLMSLILFAGLLCWDCDEPSSCDVYWDIRKANQRCLYSQSTPRIVTTVYQPTRWAIRPDDVKGAQARQHVPVGTDHCNAYLSVGNSVGVPFWASDDFGLPPTHFVFCELKDIMGCSPPPSHDERRSTLSVSSRVGSKLPLPFMLTCDIPMTHNQTGLTQSSTLQKMGKMLQETLWIASGRLGLL